MIYNTNKGKTQMEVVIISQILSDWSIPTEEIESIIIKAAIYSWISFLLLVALSVIDLLIKAFHQRPLKTF